MSLPMKKILLIEDDLPLLRMYQFAFRKAGYEILYAIDGEEGLRKIRETMPDLILLDLVLPKKSGFEVLAEVKGDSKLATIPVICLSVLHQEEDIKKCKDLGADDYFVKTDISPHDVVGRVLARVQN